MQSRIAAIIQRQVNGPWASLRVLGGAAAAQRFMCSSPTGRPGDTSVHSGPLEGEDAEQAELAAQATKAAPKEAPKEEREPLAPQRPLHSTPKLENPGPSAPLGHQKIQKRRVWSKPWPPQGEIKKGGMVVWTTEQLEHPEETMVRRANEIYERSKMRGDPDSPQSKRLNSLRPDLEV